MEQENSRYHLEIPGSVDAPGREILDLGIPISQDLAAHAQHTDTSGLAAPMAAVMTWLKESDRANRAEVEAEVRSTRLNVKED